MPDITKIDETLKGFLPEQKYDDLINPFNNIKMKRNNKNAPRHPPPPIGRVDFDIARAATNVTATIGIPRVIVDDILGDDTTRHTFEPILQPPIRRVMHTLTHAYTNDNVHNPDEDEDDDEEDY